MKNRTVSIAFVILVVTAALFLATRYSKDQNNDAVDPAKGLALSQVGIQEQVDDAVNQATLLS